MTTLNMVLVIAEEQCLDDLVDKFVVKKISKAAPSSPAISASPTLTVECPNGSSDSESQPSNAKSYSSDQKAELTEMCSKLLAESGTRVCKSKLTQSV